MSSVSVKIGYGAVAYGITYFLFFGSSNHKKNDDASVIRNDATDIAVASKIITLTLGLTSFVFRCVADYLYMVSLMCRQIFTVSIYDNSKKS